MASWSLIVPVIGLRGIKVDADNPLQFSDGVLIRPLPDWIVQQKNDIFDLGFIDYDHLKNATKAFIINYETKNEQDNAERLVFLAQIALWLAKPGWFKSYLYIHDKGAGNDLTRGVIEKWRGSINKRRPVLFSEPDESIKSCCSYIQDDIKLAQKLHDRLNQHYKPECRGTIIWNVIYLLIHSLVDDFGPSRFLLLWCIMEALFGPQNAQEITYRISNRCAFFLSEDKDQCKKTFDMVKNRYSWRSKVIHGYHVNKITEDESIKTIVDVQNLLREALVKILLDEQLINIFNSNKHRDEYLDDLIINATWRNS